MQILRQSTQVIVRIGPFVDVGDGFTPQTDITLGGDEAELLKNASVEVDISGRTWEAITNCRGWYDLTLTTADTNTVGLLTVVIQDDSDCLPVFRDFQVVEEVVYDELFKNAASGVSDACYTALINYLVPTYPEMNNARDQILEAILDLNDITAADVVTALMANTGITEGGTWTFEKLMNVFAAALSGKRQLKAGQTNIYEFLDPDDGTTVVFEMTVNTSSPYFTFNVLI